MTAPLRLVPNVEDIGSAPAEHPREPEHSGLYKAWVVTLLMLMMLSMYMDRSIVGILAQPIKAEFHISDFEIGLLGGLSFAILYMVMGIPIARLAERYNRVTIITVSLILWSALTALSGWARSYAQLLILRVFIGIGEAGGGAPSQSLIADYFPPRRRSTALAFYAIGLPIGGVAGIIVGGLAAQAWGWRAAFMVVGIPGLLLAVLLKLTVREPQRGAQDSKAIAVAAASGPIPSLWSVTRYLIACKTFRYMVLGSGLSNFAGQGIAQFSAAYFMRRFGLSIGEVGLILGISSGVAAAIGISAGGLFSDWAARHDKRWYAWLPAITFMFSTPFLVLGYLQPTWTVAVVLLSIAGSLHPISLGPLLGVTQNLVAPRMRATAGALLGLVTSSLGFGLGPITVGFMSDRFAAQAFAGKVPFTVACPGGIAHPGAATALKSACLAASAAGIDKAIVITCFVFILAGFLFLISARTLRQDLEAAAAPDRVWT
jgi:predicted MFS family arabinose efflux permease